MAVLTLAAFISKWNTKFADNSSRAITEAFMREFAEDIKDSFQSIAGATPISSWKDPCAVATTTNITLSGEQTIDGVLTSGSRVLVKDQASADENGIYVSAAGAWSRATDANADAELEGAAVGVNQGTTNKNTVWLQTTDSVTLGTSDIIWQQIGYGSTVSPEVELQSISVNVSSAEILSLWSSPKEIIPAPGAGKYIELVRGAVFLDYGGTAYATQPNVAFYYDSGLIISGSAAVLDKTQDYLMIVAGFSQNNNWSNIEDAALQLRSLGSDPTLGNGTLVVKALYRIVTI